jgi:hypothetical protein
MTESTVVLNDTDDTRIQRWDPICDYIVMAGQHWPHLVNEGVDKVLEMARCYQSQSEMRHYFDTLADKLVAEGIKATSEHYGTMPGGDPYLDIVLASSGYITLHFDEAYQTVRPEGSEWSVSGGATWINENQGISGEMDFIFFPDMRLTETVLAGIRYFVALHS